MAGARCRVLIAFSCLIVGCVLLLPFMSAISRKNLEKKTLPLSAILSVG